jgi:hypothetical protein
MGLWERVTREQEPRISVHALMAALAELERGKLTTQQVIDLFALSAGEQTELATILAKVVYPREAITFGAVPTGLTLTNVGASFDAIVNSQNMGFAHVQTAGITQVIFCVRVNKIGSGTQSWQLWNETDGNEVAVIDDAGATGLKYLSVTKDFSSPLGAGMKVVRVRVKSTTAADDPIYFGATASVRRVAALTGIELHEVLLLADMSSGPYSTAAALKTRLGV